LPRDWLVAHIERYAESLLGYEDYEEYRRLLELYSLIDRDPTLRLARRAAAHDDADIKEAGEDFLANPDPVTAILGHRIASAIFRVSRAAIGRIIWRHPTHNSVRSR
jgi:hypothetical protein